MRPLEGKRILVTRPAGQASQLSDRLADLGAVPVHLPAIEIAPLEDYAAVDSALRNLRKFDWVVFTSVNGIAAASERMKKLGLPAEDLSLRKLATIGPSTAAALKASFREPDIVPSEYVAEALAPAMGNVRGQKILMLRADLARKELAHELRRKGGQVTEIAAYRILSAEGPRLDSSEPQPDFITLTSSASARATQTKLRDGGHEDWMRKAPIACIGPITSRTVRDMGYNVAIEADEYTIPGLVAAIVKYAEGPVHA